MEKLQPKLRFPEFKENWLQKKLSDVSTIGRGKSKHRPRDAAHLYGGKYPFIQTGDIRNSSLYLTSFTQTYSEEGLKQSKLWDENTLCITIAANIAETTILKIKACFPDSIIGLIPKEEETIVLFVKYQFDKFKIEIQSLSQGVAQANLNQEKISNIEFNFPTLPEQTKIASFLSSVDEKLNLLKEKKAALEEYKKGMMQKIFSQEIRFKPSPIEALEIGSDEFPEWEELQLSELLVENKQRNKNNTYKEVFSIAKSKGVINQLEHLGRSYASENISNYKVVYPNDLVYTKSPTSDFPYGIIKQNKLNRSGVVSVLYGVFTPKNEYVGSLLQAYFDDWKNTYNYLDPIVQKGAKNTINIGNQAFLSGEKISFPIDFKEQTKIATFLSAIDEKISLVSTQIEETQAYKKGLLQGMFC